MELYANNCVWVSRWEMVKDTESGKTRRVRRARPKVYAGTVYTVQSMEQDDLSFDLRPFIGWTWRALHSGAPAKHYSRPVAIFRYKEEMWEFVNWLEALLNWAFEYGHTWFGGSPVQIGWNGVHDNSDRGDCKTCELCDHYDCPYTGRSDVWACNGYREDHDPTVGVALPQAFGNLVWARVRGLRTKHTDESVALLDLEQITRSDKYDPYVRVMHAYPRDYGNDGIYATEIVEAPDRAMRVIKRK